MNDAFFCIRRYGLQTISSRFFNIILGMGVPIGTSGADWVGMERTDEVRIGGVIDTRAADGLKAAGRMGGERGVRP
jgi:hypothetical protein